jgi:aldehyde dehydrogenase (NAD+)
MSGRETGDTTVLDGSVKTLPATEDVDANAIAAEVDALWDVYRSSRTVDLKWRTAQLHGVRSFLNTHRDQIQSALAADLGKPEFEAYAADIAAVLSEASLLIGQLPKLIRPRKVPTPMLNRPATSWIYPEPVGPVLLLPAWNYPFGLALLPLLGALAAGNPVALKPSELAPRSAELIAETLTRYVDPESVKVFEGGPNCAQALLQQKFGHIHYTGSASVGRLVMTAAAAHLTPVTLELGGKNPAYVHSSADVDVAAKRIFWGRMMNAGQVCLSPDYVLVDREVQNQFLDAVKRAGAKFYGPDPQLSRDFARIVNDRHFDRICALIDGAGDIVLGGQTDRSTRYVAPTVIVNVDDQHPIMREEIFGPVLPVRTVSGPDEAIEYIRTLPTPLATYVFANDPAASERVLGQTTAGSAVVNHVFVHGFNPHLPFGGVGESGMGRYTGLSSFECFSNMKSVMKTKSFPDVSALFPPYRSWKLALVRRLLK